MQDKLQIQNGPRNITISLLDQRLMTASILQNNAQRTLLFQKVYEYDALPQEFQFLFADMVDLYETLGSMLKTSTDSITSTNEGEILIEMEIALAQKSTIRSLSLKLDKTISSAEQLKVLKETVDYYGKEVLELKGQVSTLQKDHAQLKDLYRRLADIVQEKSLKKAESTKSPKKQNVESNKANQIKKTGRGPASREQSIETISQLKSNTEQSGEDEKIQQLKVAVDQKCLYFNKFKIQGKRVTSLFEDYYQLYFKQPISESGTYQLGVRMLGSKNHLSVGVFCESLQKNQYSFQNTKSVCFYTFTDGNFRGIYNRSKYSPLPWKLGQGDKLMVEVSLSKKTLTYWVGGHEEAVEVDLTELVQQAEPIFFFFEMYEKDNCIQFM